MKKILTFALCFLTIYGIKAQTQKGSWLVGGNINFNTAKQNSNFTLSPNFGHFFGNNFAAGINLDLTTSKIVTTKTTSINVGPFARYYVNLKEDNIKPFAQIGFGFRNSKVSGITGSQSSSNLLLGAGAAYFVNDKVALECLLGYSRNKPENNPATNGFVFRIGFQIHLNNSEVKRK